jgi:transposase
MDDADVLPHDLTECHRLLLAAYKQAVHMEQQLADSDRRVAEAERRLAELDRILNATSASFEELQHEHASTLEELAWYKQWVHGRRRERVLEGKGQQHLFDLTPPNVVEASAPLDSQEPRQAIAGHSRRYPGQRELNLSRLPHHRHEHDLPDSEKICSGCGRMKDRIGEDVTTILEYVPSKLEVHEHVRPKYACRSCKDGVLSPPPPQRPVARGIAGPGLIAQIVVGKFGDHLPLYRQEDIFVRHGLHLSRSTLCDWVSAAAELLEPLYERQRQLTLQSDVLWTDDTPVTVLVGGEEGSRQGRFWTYVGDDEHPYSVYHFTMSRSRDGPQSFLQTFSGLSPRRRVRRLRRGLSGAGKRGRRSGLLGPCAPEVFRRAEELPSRSASGSRLGRPAVRHRRSSGTAVGRSAPGNAKQGSRSPPGPAGRVPCSAQVARASQERFGQGGHIRPQSMGRLAVLHAGRPFDDR